jgi:hypothetical protein
LRLSCWQPTKPQGKNHCILPSLFCLLPFLNLHSSCVCGSSSRSSGSLSNESNIFLVALLAWNSLVVSLAFSSLCGLVVVIKLATRTISEGLT